MNKLCKQYISDAKKFFPIMGKKERDYLRKVSCDIEDFIEAENITSKSVLIEKYRKPYEVANNYYGTFFDTNLIIKRIKISKYIKIFISILIVVILLSASILIYFFNDSHEMSKREEMVGNDQVTLSEDSSKEHDVFKSDNFIDDEEIVEGEEIIE